MKLKPQIYKKYNTFSNVRDISDTYIVEAGLIAQEIFYDCPSLRHLVSLPRDYSLNLLTESVKNNTHSSLDPQVDPDYESLGWGTTPANVNYTGLMPYLIRGFQEQQELIKSQKTEITQQQTNIQENKTTIHTQQNSIQSLTTQVNQQQEDINQLKTLVQDLLTRMNAMNNAMNNV